MSTTRFADISVTGSKIISLCSSLRSRGESCKFDLIRKDEQPEFNFRSTPAVVYSRKWCQKFTVFLFGYFYWHDSQCSTPRVNLTWRIIEWSSMLYPVFSRYHNQLWLLQLIISCGIAQDTPHDDTSIPAYCSICWSFLCTCIRRSIKE